MSEIEIEIQYRTPRFRDLDVPRLSGMQSGRRLTIQPRDVTFTMRRGALHAYVEGRSIIQSTGMPGQHNRGLSFGEPWGEHDKDTTPWSVAPGWLSDLADRVREFERLRISADVVTPKESK